MGGRTEPVTCEHGHTYLNDGDDEPGCEECEAEAAMPPDEFAQRMRDLVDNWDPEEGHIRADELMLAALRSLGYGEGCDLFEGTQRWYA